MDGEIHLAANFWLAFNFVKNQNDWSPGEHIETANRCQFSQIDSYSLITVWNLKHKHSTFIIAVWNLYSSINRANSLSQFEICSINRANLFSGWCRWDGSRVWWRRWWVWWGRESNIKGHRACQHADTGESKVKQVVNMEMQVSQTGCTFSSM